MADLGIRRCRAWVAAGVTLACLVGRAARADEVQVKGRTFQVPAGFVVELAAESPLVDRPITMDFDERGRLYVADSSGSNDPVQEQLAERPHRIVRLEDRDGDGRFDHRTVFADRMMFPEGTLWHDGSLYVSAPPSIWKLTDTDDDGVADRREEWFEGKTLTGCANDLHGPYEGLDGWIYWCKGAFAEQTYERPGRSPFVTRASHIFRRSPVTNLIEPVMTGGMDNPVDVAFTPGGEPIFTCTFLQNPAEGKRDGLIHAVYGGVYGKVHDVIEGHPRTRPEVMPPLSHLGPAAPCGLTRYESDAFGGEYRDNLFATLFNLHKVTRHVLRPTGGTFTSADSDFLATADQDFHPTDIIEDADGSLLVIDTGGWYKLCCPTSQLWKPDLLGGIYRVRRADSPMVADARGLELNWNGETVAGLIGRLGDPRPVVRRRAVKELGTRGDAAVETLERTIRESPIAEVRRGAVWAAVRMPGDAARGAVAVGLDDGDETVRQAALHGVSLWRDGTARTRLEKILAGTSTQNARAAAEAMGRVGDRGAVPVLLEVAGRTVDDIVRHATTYALIEIGDAESTRKGLQAAAQGTRLAALVALDQMEGSTLRPEEVAELLWSSDARTREAASWIVGRHPEWGGALAGTLAKRLDEPGLGEVERAQLESQLARLAGTDAILGLLATRLEEAGTPPVVRASVLRAMGEADLEKTPRAWVAALTRALESTDSELRNQAVATARRRSAGAEGNAGFAEALLAIAQDGRVPVEVRLEALAALPGRPVLKDPAVAAFLRAQLAPEQPVAQRLTAAGLVARAAWTPEQLEGWLEVIATAGPLELDKILGAFDGQADATLGARLVAALEAAPAMQSLRPEGLRAHFEKAAPEVKEAVERLVGTLSVDLVQQRERLQTLKGTLPAGDVRRGQAVFNGSKAACATCHAIGYLGGKVGPDLTRIGQIRNEGDLLEAIVYPSASFVRSYEPVLVATRDGQVFNGILKGESQDSILITLTATEEKRIARGEIDEMSPGSVSVMPAGLDQQLSTQDLADLVEFLRSCK